MASVENRIKAIENQVKPDKPLAVIYQDLDDPQKYRYGDQTILESDLANLDDNHIWLIVVYDRQDESLDEGDWNLSAVS